MSKQSIEQILKDVIESSNAKTVALTEQLHKLAGDKDTYTERLQKMEESLTSAMQKVLEMDANIKDFHKAFGSKVDEMENKFASWWKNNEDEMEKPENWDDMTEDEQADWIEMNAKKEVAKASKKAENVIDGINQKVVKGQPNPAEDEETEDEQEAKETEYKAGKKGKKGEMPQFIKDKIEEREEEEESAEDCDDEKPVSKKGKKAGKLKIEHEGEIEVENESEEKEEEEVPAAKKGKKALEKDVVAPTHTEVTAEPIDEDAAEVTEKLEHSVAKKAKKATVSVPTIEQGEPVETTEELDEDASETQDSLENSVAKKAKKAKKATTESEDEEIGNAPAVNHKHEEETEETAKGKKGKRADDSSTSSVADVAKIVESVSGKIEAAYEKLANATMKQAAAESRATEGDVQIKELKTIAERETSAKTAALEAAKTLAAEVVARDESAAALKSLEAKLAEMTKKLAALEVADKSAEMKAAKMVASSGLAEPVDSSPTASSEDSEAEVMSRFESLSGKEQRAFYLANKALIERVAFKGAKNRFR